MDRLYAAIKRGELARIEIGKKALLYAIDLAAFPARLKGTRQATNQSAHSVGAHPGPRLALSRRNLDL